MQWISVSTVLVCCVIQVFMVPSSESFGFALARSSLWVEQLHWSCWRADTGHIKPSETIRMPYLPPPVCFWLVEHATALCSFACAGTSLIALSMTSQRSLQASVVLNPILLFLPSWRSGSSFAHLIFAAIVASARISPKRGIYLVCLRLGTVLAAVYFLGWRTYFAVFAAELAVHCRCGLLTRCMCCSAVAAVFAYAVVVLSPASDEVVFSASHLPNVGSRWYMEQQLLRFASPTFTSLLALYPVFIAQLLSLRCDEARREQGLPQFIALVASYLLSAENFVSDSMLLALLAVIAFPDVAEHAFGGFVQQVIVGLCVPLQQAYYVGWVKYDVANVNWLFFTCVALSAAASLSVVEGIRFALT